MELMRITGAWSSGGERLGFTTCAPPYRSFPAGSPSGNDTLTHMCESKQGGKALGPNLVEVDFALGKLLYRGLTLHPQSFLSLSLL